MKLPNLSLIFCSLDGRLSRPHSLDSFRFHDVDSNANVKRTSGANAASENSLFIVTVCVKSVPIYHSKLAYVVPDMAVKEFLETHL